MGICHLWLLRLHSPSLLQQQPDFLVKNYLFPIRSPGQRGTVKTPSPLGLPKGWHQVE